jgi:hypothetical protein
MKAVYEQSRGAHQAAQSLQPLLGLLDEQPEERSALQELTDSLEAILLGQRQLMLLMEDIDKKLDALARR